MGALNSSQLLKMVTTEERVIIHLSQKCTNPKHHIAVVIKLCMVANQLVGLRYGTCYVTHGWQLGF